jgi:hypothetical protein
MHRRLWRPNNDVKAKMSYWKTLLLGLGILVTSGCVSVKYQGLENLVTANPKGWDDAVNGSHYRDGSDDSERMMRSLGRYINELEQKLESE